MYARQYGGATHFIDNNNIFSFLRRVGKTRAVHYESVIRIYVDNFWDIYGEKGWGLLTSSR